MHVIKRTNLLVLSTPLVLVMLTGCSRVAKESHRNPYGQDIFMSAKAGDVVAVRKLLDGGKNPNIKDASGRTPFLAAATLRQEQVLRLLASRGADVNARDSEGNNAMHQAVVVTWSEGVRVLKSLGTDINARNKKGWAPLRLAIEITLREPVADELIKNGASVAVTDYSGYTPVHAAIQEGYVPLAKRMLARGGREDIFIAAYFGHQSVVRCYVERGAKINGVDGYGYTPLHWAALGAQRDVANYLISRGANVNASNSFGCTPLHMAVGYGDRTPGRDTEKSAAVASLLISSGADQNATAKNGWTPAMVAQQSGIELPMSR